MHKERTNERTHASTHLFLQWKLDPNAWKSSAGIHALKTSGEEEQGDYVSLSFAAGS